MRNNEIEELKKDYEIIINRLRDAIFYGDKRDEEGLRSAASDCQEQAEKLGYNLKSSVKDGNLVANYAKLVQNQKSIDGKLEANLNNAIKD